MVQTRGCKSEDPMSDTNALDTLKRQMEEMVQRQEKALQPGYEHGSACVANEENFDDSNRDTLEQDTPSQHTGKRPREDNHHEDSSGDTSISQHHFVRGHPHGRSTGRKKTNRYALHRPTLPNAHLDCRPRAWGCPLFYTGNTQTRTLCLQCVKVTTEGARRVPRAIRQALPVMTILPITFNDSDFLKVKSRQDNPMVITVVIADWDVRKILVDKEA
ncbi:hypothetical protein VNO78_21468 [Psophocarpus tetragonolobus]|uniref:Uncharacterized protein n=1 Tax=Psophocarpus tetragonolobus TaxID=3891 RepID=A0AAN9SFD0_PSOTE